MRNPVLVLLFCLSVAALAQKGPYEEDIRALTAAGSVENNTYSNPHAGFVLHLPLAQCQPKLNTSADFSQGYAMLLSCVRDKGDGGYTFHIQAETWAHYPGLTLEQYVRSVRHLAERDPDMQTIQVEDPTKMGRFGFFGRHRDHSSVWTLGLCGSHLYPSQRLRDVLQG